MRKRLSLQDYAAGIRSGNRVILSQAITLAESTLDSDRELASLLVQELGCRIESLLHSPEETVFFSWIGKGKSALSHWSFFVFGK
ncbi:MAG: hypothetical protein ACJLTB_23200 [Algoriphagus aquaeductus]|uniref:hypothetical protein n=1 Tax=Algoriphagus aquaeductus TaxID=475299 RepID=UPI00387A10FF